MYRSREVLQDHFKQTNIKKMNVIKKGSSDKQLL
jgi:hypothetical protein